MRSLQTGSIIVLSIFLAGLAPLGHAVPNQDSTIAGTSPQRAADVEGVVILSVPDPSAPARLSPYARRRYDPPAPANELLKSPQSVVVYIVVAEQAPATLREVVIGQKDRTILPTVTPIQRGTRISFPNDDDVFHNLFSLSAARPFNLGRYAPGTTRSVLFDKPGLVRLFCDIHSEMSGTILVLDTPYFAKPDARGNFVIRGVPAGRHKLVAWHESTGEVTSTIVVPASGRVRTELHLPG